MWPNRVDWQDLRFGVEIEFINGRPEELELLPGWIMSLDERQLDVTGVESGSELKPPPLRWTEREQIREMLRRLQEQGAEANWSCGLHVHVGLEPWGQAIVQPLAEAALTMQEGLRTLLQTSTHRLIYCPAMTTEMVQKYVMNPDDRLTLRHWGRPQSHRCGINAAAWFDVQTVEIRYANGSVDYDEVIRTVELCLRFVAAIGAGRTLPNDPAQLASELGVPVSGYPPASTPPQWYKERIWLEEALLPVLSPLVEPLVDRGEVHHILPVPDGILVAVEVGAGELRRFLFRPTSSGWELLRE